jgi:hypothetical protein
MTSLNDIVYPVAHTLGRENDHAFIEKLKLEAVGYREVLIRRDAEKNGIDNSTIQTLGCVPLICVDIAECCTVKTKVNVLRTELKIPKPLRTKDSSFYYFVGLATKRVPFTYLNHEELEFAEYDKYIFNYPRYSYRREYVYVFNPPVQSLTHILIESPFQNPQDAAKFNHCDESSCYSDDTSFYTPGDMVVTIREMLEKRFSQSPVIDPTIKVNEE